MPVLVGTEVTAHMTAVGAAGTMAAEAVVETRRARAVVRRTRMNAGSFAVVRAAEVPTAEDIAAGGARCKIQMVVEYSAVTAWAVIVAAATVAAVAVVHMDLRGVCILAGTAMFEVAAIAAATLAVKGRAPGTTVGPSVTEDGRVLAAHCIPKTTRAAAAMALGSIRDTAVMQWEHQWGRE